MTIEDLQRMAKEKGYKVEDELTWNGALGTGWVFRLTPLAKGDFRVAKTSYADAMTECVEFLRDKH